MGFLGPGAISAHLQHASGFQRVVERSGPSPTRAADLGSGGGVPGLALALSWPDSRWSLIEGSRRRSSFLVDAVRELGLDERVGVAAERAELLGRSESMRGRFDLVVARGFGPPAVVAECAAPLLRVGGRLVVSEPPLSPSAESRARRPRWPAEGLAEVGLELLESEASAEALREGGTGRFQVLRQATPCPSRYPRRTGIPAKRPIY
ncbi:MAG: 16S rRNA (guanine(527)-N(7))-methyltransferase RsmG [Acidimicrobiales bacterium]